MAKPLHECIPKRLKIAGKSVEVVLLPLEIAQDIGIWGRFYSDAARIEICPFNQPDQVLDTILHEVLHACYAYWNIQDHDDEERIVHTLGSALQSLYVENDHLLRCIAKYTKAARLQSKTQ